MMSFQIPAVPIVHALVNVVGSIFPTRKFDSLSLSSTLSVSQRSSSRYLSTIYLPLTSSYPSLIGLSSVILYQSPSVSENANILSLIAHVVVILSPGTYTLFGFFKFKYLVTYFKFDDFMLESIACALLAACSESSTLIPHIIVGL